jgi:phage shock protein A
VLAEAHWAIFEVAPGLYLANSNLVAAKGVFGGAPARLKAVVAGSNIAFVEAAETLTINATAAPVAASLLAGEHITLTEVDGQVRIAVPNLTTLRTDHEAVEARVAVLEGPVMRAGRIRVDDAIHYDDAFTLHVGWDRIMAQRAHISVVNANELLASLLFRADEAGERDPAVQLHVTPGRVFVKDLQAVTSFRAPTLDVPNRLLVNSFPLWDTTYTMHITTDRVYCSMVDSPQLQTQFLAVTSGSNSLRADTSSSRQSSCTLHVGSSKVWAKALEADSLVAPEVTALATRATALETRATAVEALNATQQTEIVDLKARASTLETGVSIHEVDITALQTGAATLGTDVDALETATASLQTRTTTLEATAASQSSKVGLLATRVEVLETANASKTTQISDLGIRATALENVAVMFGGDIETLKTDVDAAEISLGTLTTRTDGQDAALTQLSSGVGVLQTNVGSLTTRVGALESETDDIPGKLKVDSTNVYDSTFVAHIGGDRLMTARLNTSLVDAVTLLTRGAGQNVFRAGSDTVRDSAFQAQVGPDRMWVKNLTVETTITSQQLNLLNTNLTTVTNQANGLQVAVDDVESDVAALQTGLVAAETNFNGLQTRVSTLEANAITGQPAGSVQPGDQHFVITGSKIIPLVAGPGVEIETVNSGLLQVEYLRVSARPLCAGMVASNATVVSSSGRVGFSVTQDAAVGSFRIQMNAARPSNTNGYVVHATPYTTSAQRAIRIATANTIELANSTVFRVYTADAAGTPLYNAFHVTVVG